jgi:methylated-DNA-protein-cysteine methyltransferase-like protein
MAKHHKSFDESVWSIVSRIPHGQVMSYGEVASAAGYPRHARMVSKAMGRAKEDLPWYRVVRSDRTLAFVVESDAYNRQRSLLEKEGVQFVDKKAVSLASASNDVKDMDKMLWGSTE